MATFSKVLLGLGPLAYWSFGEPVSASAISDLSGNGYGATYTGYISFNQTAITDHPCTRFYGGYGLVKDQSALRLNGAHTIVGICKPLTLPASTWPGGIRKGNSATANGYVLFTDSSGSVYFKRNNVSIGFSSGVSIGVSTMVGFSYSGSVVTAYKNGSLEATQSVTFPTNSGTDQIWLGRGDNTGDQIWSDLAIFNRSLTAYEHLLLADAAGLATLPRVTIGNNVTVSGSGAGDYVAIIDATTKELVKLTEPDTNGDWTYNIPYGTYYICFFAENCISQIQGPFDVTVSGISPTLNDVILIDTSIVNVDLQFSGYMSSFGIFKKSEITQEFIDNLFLSSRILGGYEIIGESYVNGIKTADVPLVLLNKYYHAIGSTISDSNGDYVFQNLQYDTYYVISDMNGATNDINGPILPTLMV